MKLAVAGKGGAGKTTVAGTIARVLARDGARVLAIDADAGPNLALTLGVEPERLDAIPTLPRDLLGDGGLARSLDDVRREYAVRASDGVELLVMARPERADTGCLTDLHTVVRTLVAAVPSDEVCVLDTDATAEGFARGVARHADTMLLVVEASPASLETGRRMAALARDLGIPDVALVASKVRDARDVAAVRALGNDVGLKVAAEIPFDTALGEVERAARAPLDGAPGSPAVLAVTHLARTLYVRSAPTGRVASS